MYIFCYNKAIEIRVNRARLEEGVREGFNSRINKGGFEVREEQCESQSTHDLPNVFISSVFYFL